MTSKKGITVTEATRKLEHYCVYQERCHQEVIQKLKRLGMGTIAIDHIVAHLITHKFLNEERFARSFARGKFHQKKWGRNRIISELKQRNISEFNIRLALQEINPHEYLEVFDALVDKRLIEINNAPLQKRKRKLADYLIYRGWESHLVYEKVNELL
ncbi:MAG: regulatory protein RecX [Bacteroidota bacterium]